MEIAALASVFGIAFFSLWASIPAGLALNLHPLAVILTAALSYAAGVGLIVLVGQPVRDRILRRFGGSATSNPNTPIRRAWDRYGLIGLSLLAPVTTGAQIGAIIGMSLNAEPRRLFLLMSLGGLLWAALFGIAIALGIEVVRG
jgi:uncharacterized membrane protein